MRYQTALYSDEKTKNGHEKKPGSTSGIRVWLVLTGRVQSPVSPPSIRMQLPLFGSVLGSVFGNMGSMLVMRTVRTATPRMSGVFIVDMGLVFMACFKYCMNCR